MALLPLALLLLLPLALALLLAADHLAELAHHALHLLPLLFAHLLAGHAVQLFGHPAHRLAGLLPILSVAVQVLGGVLHLPTEALELASLLFELLLFPL